MIQAGNKVIFEKGNCRTINGVAGEVMLARETKGGFEMGLWVNAPRVERGATKIQSKLNSLSEESETEDEGSEEPVVSLDFIRQAKGL